MSLLELLKKDVRFQEGLNACINCGTCTAICPAARFYNYDPRIVVETVQRGNEADILALLESDTIWYCGECLSCKTRCPRNNTPGYIIQALRNLSQELGFFTKSEKGRQQLEVKRIIGENMIKYGYCVYLDEIDLEGHPEQGPVWQWYKDNADSILKRLGANYKGNGPGTLRKISDDDMLELNRIFEVTGAIKRFEEIEKFCENKIVQQADGEKC
jgi:heterodisulfide reductase subunit C